jgi:hypothetical protein
LKTSSHGLVIDGFVRGTRLHGGAHSTTHKIKEASNLLNADSAKNKLRNTAQNVHKGAQRSQTLMRGIVHKPSGSKPSVQKAQPKQNNPSINPARLQRAKSAVTNPGVRRFGHVPMVNKNARTDKPAARIEPVNKSALAAQSKALAKPLPSMVTSVTHQQLERLLDQALTSADAHKKSLSARLPNENLWQKIKKAPKLLTVGISVFLVVLVGIFFAWRNMPQVAMKVAAARAHVAAQVPGYTPTGFGYASPVNYGNGSVSMKFKAAGNSARTYTVTQKTSDMTSKSLVDTTIPKSTQVQTSEINGTTVYIYGAQNDAVWVNHGVQFKINNQANLNSDQLLKVASGL